MPTTKRDFRIPGLLAASVAVMLPLVAACGVDENAPLYYRTDARLSTYNAASREGNADGVAMAFTRVLGGFTFLGPQGQVVSDRDVGEAAEVPGPTLTVKYTFSPKAVYSDGVKPTCDDVFLSWVAQSGRFPGFTPATTAGYRDIERVDCAPGADTAVVRYVKGRSYRDWRSLFGAGALLPAHIVARDAGTPSIVEAVRGRKPAVLEAVAKSWNTGFRLSPGPLDPARFVAFGPYRAESFDPKAGLRLVPNDKWWGQAPGIRNIVVHGRNTDAAARAANGGFDVTDTAVGIDAPPAGEEPSQPKVAPAGHSLSVEQVVLAQRGVLGPPQARQAFGACVPRDVLARTAGYGSQPWNLHVLTPASDLADPINTQFGVRYARPDIVRAREVAGQRPPLPNGAPAPPMRVRVAYLGPDARRAGMVAAIAESCRRAGIDVVDAGGPTVSVAALGSAFDAILINTGASFAAAGAASDVRSAYALFGGDPLNIGDFRNPQATEAVTRFSVSVVAGDNLAQLRELETVAWRELASIPLFATPREQASSAKLTGVIAGRARNGTGWNMDRWARS